MDNKKHVAELVNYYTCGTFDINDLRGKHSAEYRQKIIQAITKQDHPKSVCYISRLRGFIMEYFGIYNNLNCLAVLERRLIIELKKAYDE